MAATEDRREPEIVAAVACSPHCHLDAEAFNNERVRPWAKGSLASLPALLFALGAPRSLLLAEHLCTESVNPFGSSDGAS